MNAIIKAATGFAACVAVAACSGGEGAAEGEQTAIVDAKTAVITERPFRETIAAIGTAMSRPESFALLSAPAPTRVASVSVVVGQAVAKGDVLVEFERGPFLARAKAAEQALAVARSAQERAQRLVDQGIAARKEVEQATAELGKAQADDVAAQRDAELSRLESPIAGVVTKMSAVLGASVDPGQPLVEVADPNAVDVVMTVTPAEAARVKVGASVSLSTGQGVAAEPIGTVVVTDVGGAVDPDTRAVSVRARGGSLRRRLRIGESVSAEIDVADYSRALTVPIEALVPEGEDFKVFVVDANNVAHETPVKLGGRTDQVARVIDGLKAGDRVVTYGAFGMDDSAKVAPAGTGQDTKTTHDVKAVRP